jgi:nitronate monooxygenase
MSGADVARVLELGASAGQLGTAFLFCPEASVPAAWTQVLREQETVVTDAYTGRPARGARTPFLEELMAVEPVGYPLQAALLADVRSRDGYGFYMGGTGAARGREMPASELVAAIATEVGRSPGSSPS